MCYKHGPSLVLLLFTASLLPAGIPPSVPASLREAGHLPLGEGFSIRVPNMIRGRNSIPSLPAEVAFAL
ncbi:MAG TPA: hypothetical protein VLZ54_01505 [Arenibacter sp.]|nr:hypothetical protein [Arenibacter sp.]